ncbi:TadE/TadG family type IV pilus assembly protein [Alteraurantiacibacter aestuarii]|uniref:TadE/TadG family type IV pilus assembly protein n=1 Tax=Alteraurantiacibacter aestuarii TaxID=650004 RepID=UPI0031D73248
MFTRLARDHSGNVIIIFAASLFPLLALIGSGIDMGRGYLAQTRLQQACDSGVLAARKRLGTLASVNSEVPDEVGDTGQRFFNINFPDGAYGSEDREFEMVLEDNFAITGTASAIMPTTIMQAFGFSEVPISVSCQAQLNMSNTDIMMVLDVTGSMTLTNPGDTQTKIEALQDTVTGFYNQMTASTTAGTRLRFGFVPYSTNVNVGGLLQDNWLVDEWAYQSREPVANLTVSGTTTYERNWRRVSGSKNENNTVSTYRANWSGGAYRCERTLPQDDVTETDVRVSSATYRFTGPPSGTQTVESRRRSQDGYSFSQTISGSTCIVERTDYNSYVENYELVTEPSRNPALFWRYKQLTMDVSGWRTDPAANTCIEERSTYEISDYDNVDLTRALDLNIDLVPTDDDDTKWRPMYPASIFAREMKWDGTGSFRTQQRVTQDDYVRPSSMNAARCPPAARRLAEMTSTDLSNYLATLTAGGNTYHDIGMIWGGRLLSPTGLFAADNADVSSATPTTRHLIFLTDGETAPNDISYGSYGLEPIDRRRWSPASPMTLTQTVESRFAFACEEVKKRNIQVWVISFGTQANSIMETCSGPERYFVADDAAQLEQTFSDIARQMGQLRVAR